VVGIASRLLLSKEFLVQQIEESINARVQIGALDVSLFSVPTSVTLRDVIVDEVDPEVQGLSYGKRPPLSEGVIELNELSFKVSIGQLLSRKIYVDKFELDGLHAAVVLHEDGTNNLDALFGSPDEEVVEPGPVDESGFNAKEQEKFVTHLDSINIQNVSFDLLIEKTGMLVKGSECGVRVEGIEVNPNSLEQVKKAELELQCNVQLFDSMSQTVKYGEIALNGPATARLFNPKTGVLDPQLKLDLAIDESSYLNSKVPYVEKVYRRPKAWKSLEWV